jgi:uncharacterized membrane protein
MIINWPLIIILFCISVPGVCLVMKRLIYFLLPNNTVALKERFSRFAIIQTLFMVLVMSFAGAVLSSRTGLYDPLLESLLLAKVEFNLFASILLPTLLYALFGLIIFCGLYYGIVSSILDQHNMIILKRLRSALRPGGCVLYAVVEEILARWGLMNLTVFFMLIFLSKTSNFIMITSIIFSGALFAIGQLPAYIAAGCISSRRFVYSIILLSLWQSLLFGFLFWHYGLISAIVAHMLFHLGWAYYDKV